MSLYAIGDLHLALGVPEKSMETFGGRWQNYMEKIEEAFSMLTDEDLCVLCGDLSWGMDLETALPDFRFVNDLPGKKLLLKGNHDYWWATAAKMRAFFEAHGLHRLSILHNNCAVYGDAAVCGTRGWFFEEETGGGTTKRSCSGRSGLETSRLPVTRKLCFLHYPPNTWITSAAASWSCSRDTAWDSAATGTSTARAVPPPSAASGTGPSISWYPPIFWILCRSKYADAGLLRRGKTNTAGDCNLKEILIY
jgi:predicted phosphohydrolase